MNPGEIVRRVRDISALAIATGTLAACGSVVGIGDPQEDTPTICGQDAIDIIHEGGFAIVGYPETRAGCEFDVSPSEGPEDCWVTAWVSDVIIPGAPDIVTDGGVTISPSWLKDQC